MSKKMTLVNIVSDINAVYGEEGKEPSNMEILKKFRAILEESAAKLSSKDWSFLIRLAKEGDEWEREEARDLMARAIESFVVYAVHKKFGTFGNVRDDLLQEARLAAFEALINRYDPEMGSVTTYLKYPINNALHEYVTKNVSETTHYYEQLMLSIRKVIAKHEMDPDDPDMDIISKELGVPINRLNNAIEQAAVRSKVAITEEMAAVLPDKTPTPEAEIIRKEQIDEIRAAMECLSEEEKLSFSLRHGLGWAPLRIPEGIEMKSVDIDRMMHNMGVDFNAQYAYVRAKRKLRNHPKLRRQFNQKSRYENVKSDIMFNIFDLDQAQEMADALGDADIES